MTNLLRIIAFGVAMALGSISAANDVRELTWDELVPEADRLKQEEYLYGTTSNIDHGDGGNSWDKSFTIPAYTPNSVQELDGVVAKIPGFVVPLEISGEGKVKEFLLVPYFGACIHYPPPPPNQIVYVVLDEPVEIESPWDPIWAVGELKTKSFQSDLASTLYTMSAQTIEEYEY